MDPSTRSHRRAVWLIVGLLLAFLVGLIGYELNWVRQRRAARDELYDWAEQLQVAMRTRRVPRNPDWQILPARGANYLDQLVIWALDDLGGMGVPVLGPANDAKLFATFKDGQFPEEVIEELEQVQYARWLFPEADIAFEYFTDGGSKVVPDPMRYTGASNRRAP